MHIFFSGIGGSGIGPLALIAHQAGYEVSGSDKQDSDYIKYLKERGITDVHIGQSEENIDAAHKQKPIDWLVYSSAIPKENPDHPELKFAEKANIKNSKRDEFLNHLLKEKNLKLVAVAGTHGKTTTTAMLIWMFKQLSMPVSYSVGAKLGFGEMGEYSPDSKYFVYEADEYDRNFLSFDPDITVIPGIAYDHPDIYPTEEEYKQAFVDFVLKSNEVFAHGADLRRIGMAAEKSDVDVNEINLVGEVNRQNAQLVLEAMRYITGKSAEELIPTMNGFPGLSRRFEKLADNIYTDYAHTPEKIMGALQLAHEVAGDAVVVVYEGLHNTRQHFIKDQLKSLFKEVKKLYVVPSYLAREDKNLELLTPEKLCDLMKQPGDRTPSELNSDLLDAIKNDAKENVVLCLSAGGGGSLDEWLRKKL